MKHQYSLEELRIKVSKNEPIAYKDMVRLLDTENVMREFYFSNNYSLWNLLEINPNDLYDQEHIVKMKLYVLEQIKKVNQDAIEQVLEPMNLKVTEVFVEEAAYMLSMTERHVIKILASTEVLYTALGFIMRLQSVYDLF